MIGQVSSNCFLCRVPWESFSGRREHHASQIHFRIFHDIPFPPLTSAVVSFSSIYGLLLWRNRKQTFELYFPSPTKFYHIGTKSRQKCNEFYRACTKYRQLNFSLFSSFLFVLRFSYLLFKSKQTILRGSLVFWAEPLKKGLQRRVSCRYLHIFVLGSLSPVSTVIEPFAVVFVFGDGSLSLSFFALKNAKTGGLGNN